MRIESYRHKGLKALAESSMPANVKGVPAEFAKKLHRQLTMIQAAVNIQQIVTMPMWKPHALEPRTSHRWSLWVSGNFRLTFRVNPDTNVVTEVDLEDYH